MYLLDANVLIDAKNRHYAFDIVPAFWDWLTNAHKAKKVFTIEKVAAEVIAGDDELAAWMLAQPKTFRLASSPNDVVHMQTLSQWASGAHFSQAAVSTFLQAADYYLVAQAAALGYTVVTQETSQPTITGRVKIPDACNGIGVAWMTPFQMLRTEAVRFVL